MEHKINQVNETTKQLSQWFLAASLDGWSDCNLTRTTDYIGFCWKHMIFIPWWKIFLVDSRNLSHKVLFQLFHLHNLYVTSWRIFLQMGRCQVDCVEQGDLPVDGSEIWLSTTWEVWNAWEIVGYLRYKLVIAGFLNHLNRVLLSFDSTTFCHVC